LENASCCGVGGGEDPKLTRVRVPEIIKGEGYPGQITILRKVRSQYKPQPVYIRDELVLEAHPEPDHPHIPLRREGEPGVGHVYLNEVRCSADALCAKAAEMVALLAGDTESGDQTGNRTCVFPGPSALAQSGACVCS
jgi:hypothetical protein